MVGISRPRGCPSNHSVSGGRGALLAPRLPCSLRSSASFAPLLLRGAGLRESVSPTWPDDSDDGSAALTERDCEATLRRESTHSRRIAPLRLRWIARALRRGLVAQIGSKLAQSREADVCRIDIAWLVEQRRYATASGKRQDAWCAGRDSVCNASGVGAERALRWIPHHARQRR